MKHRIIFAPYSTSYGHTLVRDGRTIADVEYVTEDETDTACLVTDRKTGLTTEYPSIDAAIEAYA